METNNTPKNSLKACQTHKALADLYDKGDESLKSSIVEQLGNGTLNLVFAYGSGLSRYAVRPGKLYGKPNGRERYKILQLSGDLVFFKDLSSGRTDRMDIDELMTYWTRQGVQEITFLDEIYDFIKKHLGPMLGPTLLGALLAWLNQKLR